MDMSFILGTEVKVVRNAPLIDPVDFSIREYHVSLRYSEARGIEVEPLWKRKKIIVAVAGQPSKVEAPHDAFVTPTIKADSNSVFTFGLPRAGWWGFAALGAGGDLKHNGKELSQDAVIWV